MGRMDQRKERQASEELTDPVQDVTAVEMCWLGRDDRRQSTDWRPCGKGGGARVGLLWCYRWHGGTMKPTAGAEKERMCLNCEGGASLPKVSPGGTLRCSPDSLWFSRFPKCD